MDNSMQSATFEDAMLLRAQAFEAATCTCEGDPQAAESCAVHGTEYSAIVLHNVMAEARLENEQSDRGTKPYVNEGAYLPETVVKEKDISIREAMRPGYTFAAGGGSKSKKHEDAKDLKAKAPSRPWIEDEPRTLMVVARISPTTRALIAGKNAAQIMYDIARAIKSGRDYDDIMARNDKPEEPIDETAP